MQPIYFKEAIEAFKSNPYFDMREHKGCTPQEIESIKKMIAPYMKRMPRAIEEDLYYFGKFCHNWSGPYLNMVREAFEDEFVDMDEEFKQGFWVFIPAMGILCDESTYLSQFIDNKELLSQDYDDPSFFNKNGYEEDNDIILHILIKNYSAKYNMRIEELLPKYKKYYEKYPMHYQLKQALVDLYDEIESCAVKMPKERYDLYEGISNAIRDHVGRFILASKLITKMKDIMFRFRRGDLEELKSYSDKIEHYYQKVNDIWDTIKEN